MNPLDEVLTLDQAASLLGRSASTLRHQAQVGQLDARRLGKTWLTTKAEVERYRRSNLGRIGRPEVANLVDEIPWPSSMYRDVWALRILAFDDSPPADVTAIRSAVATRIEQGAWTMAEVISPIITGADTRSIPLIWRDNPPAIVLTRIAASDGQNLLEQRPPFEDVIGRPGEPNVLADDERTDIRQDWTKIDPRNGGGESSA